MNITTHNYHDVAKNINWATVPGSLVRMSKELIPNASGSDWAAYKAEPELARIVNIFFGHMATQARKQGIEDAPAPPMYPEPKKAPRKSTKKPVSKPAAKAKPMAKPQPAAKPKKSAPVKGVPQMLNQVEHVLNTIQFVKRYVALNGKTKSAEDLAKLLHGVQKAILERRITKASQWAAEVDHMQTSLSKAIEQMDATGSIKVEIKPVLLKSYQIIAQSENAMPSVRLLKRYIGLTGKRGVKEKSRVLRNAMWTAVDKGVIAEGDRYEAQLDAAFRSLTLFLEGRDPQLDLHPYELNGLSGITGSAVTGTGKSDLSGFHSNASSLFSTKKHQVELASAFSKTLLKYLKPKLFAEMVAEHIEDGATGESYCVSHDYCDPNQAMLDAFRIVFKRKANVGAADKSVVQRDMKVMKEAWSLAKTNNFYANPVKKKRRSASAK